MKLIHTNDGVYYRRWVNVIPSLLLPGSAQFLGGRRVAGLAWFLVSLAMTSAIVGFLIHPKSQYSVISMGPFEGAALPLVVVIAVDGCRRQIKRLRLKGWFIFICLWLCILLVPFFGIRTFLVQLFKVPTGAMQPTIMGDRKDANGHQIPGDHLFVNKLIYRFSTPQRGDVVVFRTKGIEAIKQDTFYVKRLVGLPGENVRIDPPYIYVNGTRLVEPPIFREIAEGQKGFGGYCLAVSNAVFGAFLSSPSQVMTLGPDEYLVMGDNSKNSFDGRYFGPIKRTAIIGKAFYIYAPANRKRRIE
jgi:signal peptidase I